MKRDEEKVANYFFKQTKPKACIGREGREGREGRGEGGGYQPAEEPFAVEHP